MEKVGISTSGRLADPRVGGIRRSSAVASAFQMRWVGASASREALRRGQARLPRRALRTRWLGVAGER